jgi:chromosome segregation ATPase
MIIRPTLGQFELVAEQVKARIQSQIGDLLKQRQILLNIESRINNLLTAYSNNVSKLRELQTIYGRLNSLKLQQDNLEGTIQTINDEVNKGTTPILTASLDVTKFALNINSQIANITDLNNQITSIETGVPIVKEAIPDFLVKAFIIGAITVIVSAIAGRKHK